MSLTPSEEKLYILGVIGLSIVIVLLTLNVFGEEFTRRLAEIWKYLPLWP